jgi:hypothetical protein
MNLRSNQRLSSFNFLKEFIFETLHSLNENMSKSTTGTSGTNPSTPSNNVDQTDTEIKSKPQSSAVKALDASMNSGVVAKKIEKVTKSSDKPADQVAAVAGNAARSVVNSYYQNKKLDKLTPADLLRKLKQGADSVKDELATLQDSMKNAEAAKDGDLTKISKTSDKQNKSDSKNPLLSPTK